MSDEAKKSIMDALWAARPWQGYAQNPPSMMPQLSIALGLLAPRLGGGTRDLSMARELARRPGDVVATPGLDMPSNAQIRGQGTAVNSMNIPANQNGNFAANSDKLRAYESFLEALPPDARHPSFLKFLGKQDF